MFDLLRKYFKYKLIFKKKKEIEKKNKMFKCKSCDLYNVFI